MPKRAKRVAVFCLIVVCLQCMGCASSYWRNRGNDALDIIDGGVTVSEEPAFGFYIGLLNILALGYSNVDGTLYGIGGRETGSMPMRQNAAGLLVWGCEQLAHGKFDIADPDSPQSYKVGPIGLIMGPRPPGDQLLNCPKIIHLGWYGLALNCHFPELADFLLGWTTLDIVGDDLAG